MGSFQIGMRSSALLETSCGYLLQELQMIWDEVGKDQFEREKVLHDLEQECLEVYRRKVDNANISRARLHQELAESEAEFTHLLLSLGERSLPGRPEKMSGTLKEQLDAITPALREMRLMRGELAFASQEKKVPSHAVVGQENVVGSRPDTSSRRLSNRSLNGSLSNATPINRRLSLCLQQLGTNSINSANQGISYIKEGRKMQGQRMFPRPDLTSHLRDEAASVVSSFSGPLSP